MQIKKFNTESDYSTAYLFRCANKARKLKRMSAYKLFKEAIKNGKC